MKFITILDYLTYLINNTSTILREDEEVYKIIAEREKAKYNQGKIEEVDKKHDKMFKVILSRKKEVTDFLNQFLDLKEVIKEEQIIQYPTEFITRQYKGKHIYKLKNKSIYFLIEHQSTINKNMLETIPS